MADNAQIDAAIDLARDQGTHVVVSFVCDNEDSVGLILDSLGYEGEIPTDGLGRHNTAYVKIDADNQTVLVQYDAPKVETEEGEFVG